MLIVPVRAICNLDGSAKLHLFLFRDDQEVCEEINISKIYEILVMHDNSSLL